MSTDLRETPLTDRSPLDVAEHVFQLVACAPGGLTLDGKELSHELPRRQILLTELRDLLTSRTLCNTTRDVVWRELVIRARRDGPQWLVGAVGTAVPALRRICGRLCLYPVAGDPADIDTEVLTAFIAAVKDIDLDLPNVLPRMCAAARRAGERARQNAEAEAARPISVHASKRPAAPWGHPDLVLGDAVAKGVISELDAELIGLTRLEGRTLAEAAAAPGLTCEAAKKRRQRCEPVLVAAVLAGDVESALSPTIASAAPRRTEDTPETSARSRITSDPEPITSEQKGGRGSLTGSARNPNRTRQRRRWRCLVRSVLVMAMVAITLVAAADAALADSPKTPRPTEVPTDLNTVFDNLRNWLIGLLATLATLMLTIGGLRYLVAGGDPGEIQKAKAALKAAAFGYGLAVLAPLFVSVLKRIVGGG
ncbi:hypothetical protein [Nonomuraea sp. NPDC049400]|uniref:hypothetical protein n=1 Tax=Nonomuraea sp. NPDC049400 TaxID=3364352 RepID=UPI0037937533